MSSIGGNTASGNSSIGGNTSSSASASSSTGSTAKSSSSIGGQVKMTSRSYTSIQPSTKTRVARLDNFEEKPVRELFDAQGTIDKLTEEYAVLLEQKMYAELMASMVANETEEFEEWAKSKNVSLTEVKDIEDFLEIMDTKQFTNDEDLNAKIEKVMDYIPDIIGSLAKNEALAPGIKVLQGQNPVIDEAKFTIEKVISPTLKKLGGFLEKRFAGETGKAIAKSLTTWGERLATLPTKILEGIGVYDLASSVLDASLLAIDKATGSYRQRNHDFPEEVLGIPVIGQGISILSSVRDLIDTAVGIPNDEQAINQIRDDLVENLWKPSINEHQKVMREIASQEANFEQLANKIEKQQARTNLYKAVGGRINEIASMFGNNKDDMRDFILGGIGVKYDPTLPSTGEIQTRIDKAESDLASAKNDYSYWKETYEDLVNSYARPTLYANAKNRMENAEKRVNQLTAEIPRLEADLVNVKENSKFETIVNDVNSMIDYELGRITENDLETALVDKEIVVPEMKQIINGMEIQARVSLDNVYSGQALVLQLQEGVKEIDDTIYNTNRQLDLYQHLITNGNPEKRNEYRQKVSELQSQRRELTDRKEKLVNQDIPEAISQFEELVGEYQEILEEAEKENVDLGFTEASVNWEKSLDNLEDDFFFWNTMNDFLI